MKLQNTMLQAALVAMLAWTTTACNNHSSSNKETEETTDTTAAVAASYPEEELGWKLGAQAYTFRLFSFEEALHKIKEAGLQHVEMYPGQDLTKGSSEKTGHQLNAEGRKKAKELLSEHGITLNAYGVVDGKDEAEWRQIFDFAKEMGIQVVVCEPKEAHLDILSKLCDEYNIKVAIHNHPEPSTYWDPAIVLKAIEGRSDKMGAAADVGHWERSGLNPVESLKKLEGKVFHVHFKDLNVANDKAAHDVHWGTGVIGMPQIIEELKRQQFKGMISAEYEHNWENNTGDVKASVEKFRQAL
ncbi:sugar phosphate isomerase/epimerase [Sphingobacterium sp. lm-10]|uniref:sugar phosphate isomerase/epimerase family protein n=1 Tax=Sphingobacterium sp. lm-10 TaxID=2944904 RepID=UPI0020209B3F|nr:sugar phosphate isomerase/epimerase [Sphingobacterium sp. lm-10]MCL7988315.1 sugar phosphate isomerase/epimerase [Sphingobacterium sp. lm-10]